ncbi:MAG: ABC transporter permease [Chloroflexota bacterium]
MAVQTQTAPASGTLELVEPERKQRTLWGDVWRRFRRHKLAMLGTVVFGALVLLMVLGPYIYTNDPQYADTTYVILNGAEPSEKYILGTDDIGRDTLARNLHGGRISLAVGIVAMLVAILIGTLIGLLSGFFPSLDGPLMRFTDMMLAIPGIPLLLVISMLFRDAMRRSFGVDLGTFLLIVIVIGILAWMPTARVVRGAVLSVKEKEFVEASTSVGARESKIIFRHILPNVLSPVIVSATLGIAGAILTESTISFLGLGFPPDVPTWGTLVVEGQGYLEIQPWLSVIPGILISLTILSINFIGDGLRDALDPRTRK